jgi:cell pole-organizing protein PopZ
MEDILASIRRILNEDESGAPKPAEAAPEPLRLTEDMLVQEPAKVEPAPVAPAAEASAEPPSPEPAPPEPPPPAPAEPAAAAPVAAPLISEALLAPAVAAAASAAIGDLLRTVSQERASAISRGGPTIEDVVREELRPLLKEWLDQHLPAVVERLVRSEIERVVGRALS